MPRLFFLFYLSLLLLPIISQANDIKKLEALLFPFQNIQHIKLAYHEERYSIFLKQPKKSQGTLEYIKPDQFIKTVDGKPGQIFAIKAEQLLITRSGPEQQIEQQTLSLNDYPQLKQYQALFSGLFQGSASLLVQNYDHKITEQGDRIYLLLKSKVQNAFMEQQNIQQTIEVVFQSSEITSISMTGTGQERSIITIDKVIDND